MTRIDHYNDPSAPRANRLVPAASAIVINDAGEILLHRRTDNDLWSIPGGEMEIGESIADTVVREVREETGITVGPLEIVGVYSDPHHLVEYADGEVRQQFSVCILCRPTGGILTPAPESSEVAFFPFHALPRLRIHPSIRRRIADYRDGCRGTLR